MLIHLVLPVFISSKSQKVYNKTAFSRMHTTYLETVCASISVVTTRCHSLGVGPQMNKFEQISSDHHQMSLVGIGLQVSCPGTGEGDTLPCNLSYDAFDVTYPPSPQNDRQKPVNTLPSHNFVCRRK